MPGIREAAGTTGPPREITQGLQVLCGESKKEGTTLRAGACWLYSSPTHLTSTLFLEHSAHLPLSQGQDQKLKSHGLAFCPGALTHTWMCGQGGKFLEVLNGTCLPQNSH